MVKGTLNELSQLKQSGFGQPGRRHGLNLLYWFAHEYINLRPGEIVPRFKPNNGDFGFHTYENRIDEDEEHIVPRQSFPYYEVGNLNYRKADELPDYVRRNYSNNYPDSNKDRIIVRQDTYGNIDRVYVTEHSDPRHFDTNKTFRVSQGLLQIIKNKTYEQFLSEVSNINKNQVYNIVYQSHVSSAPVAYAPPQTDNSWCTIL